MPNSQSPNSPGFKIEGDAGSGTLDQDRLRADATAVTDEVKAVAGKVTEEATERAGELASEAKAQVADAAQKVKGLAGEQKEFIAGQIGGVADAAERVATDLEQQSASGAQYARMIADNAEKLSGLVRDNDVDQLLAIAQDFGRRQPVAFLGAAALLGFAASRFVTASAQRQQGMAQQQNAEDDAGFQPATPATPSGISGYTQGRV